MSGIEEQLGDFDEEGDGELDEKSIIPDAVSVQEAKETESLQRVLIWSREGHGKTHFAYTMPEPICFIDTEGKADVIAHKFSEKDIHIFQPNNYDEAIESLEQSLDYLTYRKNQDETIGTIVVDSMSVMWRWSQTKYVEEYYPGKDPEDVEFSTGFGSGQSDWKKIKEYHNEKFRARMLESDFHLCWTAMAEEDYAAVMEEKLNYTPDKPAGEKENTYKASDVIRLVESTEGTTIGILEKSGLTRFRYFGLEYPTFEKHQTTVEEIESQEAEGKSPDEMELTHDVQVTTGRPQISRDGD